MNRLPLYVLHQATSTVGERTIVVTRTVAVWGGFADAYYALLSEWNLMSRSIERCAGLSGAARDDVRHSSFIYDPNEPGAPILV